MRNISTHTIENPKAFKEKILNWSQQFREVILLDSNDFEQKYTSFDFLVAVDAFTSIETDALHGFYDLSQYQQITKDYIFGYLSYDLKNDVEKLTSANYDGLEFPELFFFQPKKIFKVKANELTTEYLLMCEDELENDLREIKNFEINTESFPAKTKIEQRISKEKYLEKIAKMQQYIHRGDIYEANFCMEFFAENTLINPLEIYRKIQEISAPPFACYLKNNNNYLLCASPERYLRKQNNLILSQPIKGTAKRGKNSQEDTIIKNELAKNQKERSENVMIVDLVRNDLSRTATKGSVNVEELCGVYTFEQVHHLISTITSEVADGQIPTEIIATTFPMGSMTGAPKISAMKIIEELEESKRGLYSGAVGYFTPSGDFDFNVVIRSILYNSRKKYVSFSVGSAITALSVPEKEYEECLLKAKAMRTVLEA
ncbi:aminodeoxychorismate synthase component I [Flavobacterium sp. NST-5]|uniref:Aminodeoxychorismate synthase component I n=1 Tax=Flavobacterium ichthyis TaxID=2698827 RepID=A0ABW9Z6S6_9FLAO|nr:aminodeoxychorismate synthase component I [Flavobacterium ichthyis]NBL63926.1 aminodeoxychorismate synthase component I [Flavobacterium ichthyis]